MQNGGSYLDNLVLADETLGELRAAIQASPAAQNTTLVISSDHSMRVPKWRGGLYWTREDEQVFHDRFDPRPVLIIHFPGEAEQRDIPAAFPELRTHDLLEAVLQGKMKNSTELHRWLTDTNSSRAMR
jgi:membrane-anchored protein YejM (alkaline phosphatase superfamily)